MRRFGSDRFSDWLIRLTSFVIKQKFIYSCQIFLIYCLLKYVVTVGFIVEKHIFRVINNIISKKKFIPPDLSIAITQKGIILFLGKKSHSFNFLYVIIIQEISRLRSHLTHSKYINSLKENEKKIFRKNDCLTSNTCSTHISLCTILKEKKRLLIIYYVF